mmetsp:Transcript_68040/g.102632  ORF Transcript_68040/g.102632 Transcript_68040/m.102632 type:complete len:176 (+) Transcript_68040:245-772(+)
MVHQKTTDPLTNLPTSARITPNNNLRSQIDSWLSEQPNSTNIPLYKSSKKPPTLQEVPTKGETATLNKIIKYKGERAPNQKQLLQQNFEAYGHKYEFSKIKFEGKYEKLAVRCDGGEWLWAPDKFMFAMPQGVIFYNPKDIRECRVVPGSQPEDNPCKFGNGCTRNNCTDNLTLE